MRTPRITAKALRSVMLRPTRSFRHRRAVRIFVIASSLGLFISLVSGAEAEVGDSIVGSVRDADTDEPIEGAWIFETERRTRSGADVARVAGSRATRSDAAGRFSFEHSAEGFWSFLFRRRPERRYVFYDPSYGLMRVRAGNDGQTVKMRPSLRDAHLRQADALAFCNRTDEDEMSRTMRELACPPSRAERFQDGSPRATGDVDEQGRRDGPWTFFRADGSVIARGVYRAGGAVGVWHFEPANSTSSNQD